MFPAAFFTATALFIFSSTAARRPPPNGILYDLSPFIRVYANGTVQRFIGQEFAPPGVDAATGVQSRDVKYSSTLNLTARIYLPGNAAANNKLPLLIYYHGGGFFTESAFSPTYHRFLNSLSSAAGAIAVSVNYRLAPEHPLPIAYEDSWLALKWAISGAGNDSWLKKHADFQRVYLGGDSAGGNLAHNMATRIGGSGLKIEGMFLNCPYFISRSTPELQLLRDVWIHAYPKDRRGLNDPLVNPAMDPGGLKRVGLKHIALYMGEKDPLKESEWDYKKGLERSGWKGKVEAVEFKGEGHVFNLLQPGAPDAAAMLKMIAAFINNEQ
ncbi:hypothetical protein M569_06746 [Genlisea aurea]|uniref:Alpha/beta hydrolase fold-3 domain-containing protein n=1 Tax=Genlisea aurea TaxID=192259 RepID=S8DXM1_9LAMI|nr:hypothetical protein M569_06746 [Genlisea aurea]